MWREMDLQISELTQGVVRNLSGHERGVAARRRFELDRLDEDQEMVVRIIVPEDLDAITTSFFQGCFAESVNRLGGRDAFLRKYKFLADEFILSQVNRGINAVVSRH